MREFVSPSELSRRHGRSQLLTAARRGRGIREAAILGCAVPLWLVRAVGYDSPVTQTTNHTSPPSFEPRNPRRLAALRSYGILDTQSEPEFDDIAHMAAQACDAPMAHINFIDADRQWIKAAVGHDEERIDLAALRGFRHLVEGE